jgi:protein-S-isoprenylcysteine O-methyltransferase Ste14
MVVRNPNRQSSLCGSGMTAARGPRAGHPWSPRKSESLATQGAGDKLPVIEHPPLRGPGASKRCQNNMLPLLSILAYVAMVGGLIGLLVTRSLFSSSVLVIIPQAVAVLLMIWARVTFGRRSFHLAANPTAGGLVTIGPYRFIRHPIYTGVCVFAGAGVLAHCSWKVASLGGLVLAGALFRLFCEEALVAKRYPEYCQYAARTWRMVPFVF